jgi:hypothetical protein
MQSRSAAWTITLACPDLAAVPAGGAAFATAIPTPSPTNAAGIRITFFMIRLLLRSLITGGTPVNGND